jgi:LysM repeat protein
MVTSQQALKKYGDPNLLATQTQHFITWSVPQDIQQAFSHVRFSAVGTIGFPKRIFINKDFQPILERGLRNLITRGLANEMKTWDGCFIIRQKRGLTSMSLHSWALAVDINAFENGLGQTPKLSSQFVKAMTDAGMTWGGNWTRKDGMHFEISKLPALSVTPAPGPTTTPTVGLQTQHTVVSGDTLSGIARRYNITVNDLRRLNNLTSDLIRIGQILRIR